MSHTIKGELKNIFYLRSISIRYVLMVGMICVLCFPNLYNRLPTGDP